MRADKLLESRDFPSDAVDRAQQDQVAGVREALDASQALGRPRTIVDQGVAAIELARVQVEPAVRAQDERMTGVRPDQQRSDPGMPRQRLDETRERVSIALLVIRSGWLVK